jgi:hypothetical protein
LRNFLLPKKLLPKIKEKGNAKQNNEEFGVLFLLSGYYG